MVLDKSKFGCYNRRSNRQGGSRHEYKNVDKCGTANVRGDSPRKTMLRANAMPVNRLNRLLDARESELVEIRRALHRHPELGGYEENTLTLIREKLREAGIGFTEVEKGGILAFLGGGADEKTVLLRADMDALPICEDKCNLAGEKLVLSQTEGVAHLCGHDAHTAMLLTCGSILKSLENELDGRVILCFERAEEGGGPGHAYGVYPILKYLEDNHIRVDRCFALHVNPELEAGKISAEPGGVMAGNCGFEVHIKGRAGHGSRPDLANNPLDCFCDLYQALCKLPMRRLDPYGLFTFSIPLVKMGSYGNVIADELYFEGTARSLDRGSLEIFRDEFLRLLKSLTAAYRCAYDIDTVYVESPLCNDADCAARIRQTVETCFGSEHYLPCKANLGSESFAHYTARYPGAMAFLGVKNTALGSGAPLHSARFDLDEGALKYGAGVLAGFALDALSKTRK